MENVMINPHDSGLQDRIKGFEKSIKARLQKINLEKHKEAFADGVNIATLDFETLVNMSEEELEKITKQTDAMVEIDKEIEKELCEEIDAIFNSDVSSKAFKYVPPLAMIPDENGDCEMYILLVLKALAVEIQKYGDKMNNATNKYVAKYPKNK
ncbi:MAG: hypothetical protein J6Q61_06475 [Bacteroidales bacterium]|nr:hypothetical protein [Bacteroidales bacterium]